MTTKFLKHVWTALLVVIGIPISSNAQIIERLFVYSPNGVEQSFALDNLKLTFTEQGINMLPATGNATVLHYDDVSIMTFEPQTTAILAVKNSDLKLYWEADNLKIESDTEISAVKLYNLQGNLLVQQSAQTLSTTIPLQSCPTGVYIVQIVNKQGVSIHKIIKR